MILLFLGSSMRRTLRPSRSAAIALLTYSNGENYSCKILMRSLMFGGAHWARVCSPTRTDRAAGPLGQNSRPADRKRVYHGLDTT
jgi:hypothetical protein